MKAHISSGAIKLVAETELDCKLIRSIQNKTFTNHYAPSKAPQHSKKGAILGLIELFLHEVKEDISAD